MRTMAIPILTLFMLTLLIPASSADNKTHHNLTNTNGPEGSSIASTQSPTTTEKKVITQNDTTPVSPSTSHFTTRDQPVQEQFSSPATTKGTTGPSRESSNTKLMCFVILLAIVVLMLFVGCLHAMRDRDSSVSRFLLSGRKRLRDVIGNLEDRMGLRLWPVGTTGGEDDEQEAEGRLEEEGGQTRANGGEGGSRGVKNKENEEQKEEDSDDSHDSSSMEGDNLKEMTLSRREEEEKKQSGNEDEEETSSESEGDQSAVEGQNSGDKTGGSEEIALVNSLQENDEKGDLCDVTVL